ncbi:hypothetical protein H6758_02215 [Candidatus Nomurabacteria bacterium]|nr:hypothetical protein [Candidatus Nomurabacteria bacterium]
MSFNLGQLPFYTPKSIYAAPLVDFEIQNINIQSWIDKNAFENDHHVKEVRFSLDDFHRDTVPWCVKNQVGNIVLLQQDIAIAHLCVTPCGLIHLTILPDQYSSEREQKLLEIVQPTTLSIAQPTKKLWVQLKEQGFFLRSEMVRWYAKVGSKLEPWEYLPARRAKKARYYVKKSEEYRFEILPMTRESFSAWLPIYEQEVAERENGFGIFYPKIFLSGSKMDDMKMIHIYNANDELIGGAVVNPWGGFGDIGKQPRKYTSFLLQSYKKGHRNSALAYRLAQEVMNIARDYDDHVYGYGGDFNFWGETIQPGLLSHKSVLGMIPIPELQVEAFRVVSQKNIEKWSKEWYIMQLREEHHITKKYFALRERTLVPNIAAISPSPYEDTCILNEVPKLWKIFHKGTEPSHIPLPEDIPLVLVELS